MGWLCFSWVSETAKAMRIALICITSVCTPKTNELTLAFILISRRGKKDALWFNMTSVCIEEPWVVSPGVIHLISVATTACYCFFLPQPSHLWSRNDSSCESPLLLPKKHMHSSLFPLTWFSGKQTLNRYLIVSIASLLFCKQLLFNLPSHDLLMKPSL